METALVWNGIQKFLSEIARDDLFPYIKGVKITERTITLIVQKPIVIHELAIHQPALEKHIHQLLESFFHEKSIRKITIR